MVMPEASRTDQVTQAPMGLLARVLGVFFSPRAAYAEVAARPRVLGALALVVGIAMAVNAAFAATDVGKDAIVDVAVRMMEGFGLQVSDAMYAGIETRVQNSAVRDALINQAVFHLIVSTALAGLLLGVFTAIMGGNATFKQVYAIVVHSGFIISLSQLFVTPLNYLRGTISSAANLGVFLPFLDESTFLARLLGSIDLFIIWWLISLAIGIGILYGKRTAPLANSFIGTYLALAFILATVRTAMSGA
jgi:Yip1 domain